MAQKALGPLPAASRGCLETISTVDACIGVTSSGEGLPERFVGCLDKERRKPVGNRKNCRLKHCWAAPSLFETVFKLPLASVQLRCASQ